MKADLGFGERTAKAKLGGIERDRHDNDSRICILVPLATQGFVAVIEGRGSRSLCDAVQQTL